MVDKIIIIDNFLEPNDLQRIVEYMDRQTFVFGHSSGPHETVNNQFFATYTFDELFSIYIKEKIEQTFGQKFQINRNYGHIQTFGQDGAYHEDYTRENAYTFCIYLTELDDKTMETAGGEFFIKIPNQEAILGIATRMNRGVFFPSMYLHKGMAYSRPHEEIRTCITWKLKII